MRPPARTTRRAVAFAVAVTAMSAFVGAAAAQRNRDSSIGAKRSGGQATVFDQTPNAFGIAIPSLRREDRRAFAVGNSFFRDNWVTAPASTDGRDGLGPVFNAQSCSTCHFEDGRAKPPSSAGDPERGLLFRVSRPGIGDHGGVVPDPSYGDQIQDRA